MDNVKLLNKYSKIVDEISKLGDTGGTHHDTWYCNYMGANEDLFELEEMVSSLGVNSPDAYETLEEWEEIDEGYNYRIAGICERLDKALIVAKTIDKLDELENILDENIVYG
jgi:hypothetical protein|tara:strand:+ start:7144 stop:7479 length:336 start_codon:yes stop_codon:yes gene_type:complete